MIGERFGNYTIIGDPPDSYTGEKAYLCRCDCGIEKIVTFSVLRKNRSIRCKKCHKIAVNNGNSYNYKLRYEPIKESESDW